MRLGYNFPMKLHSLFAAAMLAATIPVQAQLSIEITGAGANRIPIAVADFAGERVVAQALVSIVRADLERSGMFRLVDAGPVPIDENSTAYADLKSRGADALVAGSVTGAADGHYETRFRLHDVQKQVALGGQGTATAAARSVSRRTASATSSTRNSPANGAYFPPALLT